MRKQTTFLAVLSTAVFTASMAFPAYAKAAGWTEENGNWYYYDSYGDPLTDTWKKSVQILLERYAYSEIGGTFILI